jgi:4-amino-4-deoxychorismate lyase
VLARNEWNKHGYEGHRNKNNNFIDGLMMNADGFVIEGSMSNLFAIKDRQIFTPVLARSGVSGVMRDVIITIAESAGLHLLAKDLTLADVYDMDEIFISNSLIGLKSVNRLSHMLSGELKELTLSQKNITLQLFDAIIKTKDTYATRL